MSVTYRHCADHQVEEEVTLATLPSALLLCLTPDHEGFRARDHMHLEWCIVFEHALIRSMKARWQSKNSDCLALAVPENGRLEKFRGLDDPLFSAIQCQ
jgi:hypothetical protein